jgi:branched-chain amino acid transport system permease protein
LPLRSRLVAMIVSAALLTAAPFAVGPYVQYVVNLVVTYAVLSLGLNIVLGFAGLVSFAHSAFMGIGAYATALLMSKLGVPLALAVPVAGLVSAIIGFCVGIPAVRVRGLYLALVTIACLYFFSWVFVHWEAVTRGTTGMQVPPATFFGAPLKGDREKFYPLLLIAAVMYAAAVLLMRSRLGRAFVMTRDAELAASVCGISVMRVRALAFAVSAFYAGVGGGMFALTVGFIDPNAFGMLQMVTQFGMVLIGGLGSIAGSLVGAVLLTGLPEFLRQFRGAEEILYGLALMLSIVFMPDGIAGLARRHGLLRPTDLGGRGPLSRHQPRASSGAGMPAQAPENERA